MPVRLKFCGVKRPCSSSEPKTKTGLLPLIQVSTELDQRKAPGFRLLRLRVRDLTA